MSPKSFHHTSFICVILYSLQATSKVSSSTAFECYRNPRESSSLLQIDTYQIPGVLDQSALPVDTSRVIIVEEEKCEMIPDKGAEEGAATTPHVRPYKPDAKAPLSKTTFWRVLLSIEICMLAIAVDVYSIPVAVPTFSSDALGYLDSAWLGTTFSASFALGFLIWPRLCRGGSYKFSLAVAVEAYNLAASHVPTSVAKTAGRLIAMRAIAGAGAGGTYGLFEMILRDIIPPKSFKKYMSISLMIWAAAAAGGALTTGALVDYKLGPISFDLGPILGMIGYLMTLAFVNLPDPSWTDMFLNFRRFDFLGTLYLTGGTFCIIIVLVPGSGSTIFPWILGHPVVLSIAGLSLLAAFCFVEPLVPDPLLRPSLFLNPGILMTATVAFFYGANLYGTLYYVPHYFQLVLEDSALVSSACTLPMMFGMCVGSAAAMFIASRHQSGPNIGPAGAAMAALASGLMIRWGTSTSHGETVMVLGLLGLGQGTAFIGLLRSAKTLAGKSAAGKVPGLFTFFHALGSTFGVAGFAALYMNKLQSSLGALVPDVAETLANMGNTEDDYVVSLKPHVRDAYESSMRAGWWFMFACSLTVLALSLLMGRPRKQANVEKPSEDDGEKVSKVESGC